MSINVDKKKRVISDLKDIITKSKSLVFVNFHKLLVKDASLVRKSLKSEGIKYLVVKKTLLKKAIDSANLRGIFPKLDGELALAYGEDLISPARNIYQFQKKFDNKLNIIGGIFDGEFKSQQEMLKIALIPSLDILRGMFVNVINSPIQRLVISLGAVAEKK